MNNANKTLSDELLKRNQILDCLPGVVYIIEMKKIWETHPIKNVYANKLLLKIAGITREELDTDGYDFLKKWIHPDNYDGFLASMELLASAKQQEESSIITRIKTVYGEDYWLVGNYCVFSAHKHDGYFQIIFNGVIINNKILPHNLWLQFLREKACHEHILELACLNPMQLKVLMLVGDGLTTVEIAGKLFRSKFTIDDIRKEIIANLKLPKYTNLKHTAHKMGLN